MSDHLSDWLFKHYGREQYTPGLSRIRQALQDLLPSFASTKIVTIAGTNGKGETTLRLSTLLKQKSHCVWTSPHIERITERFRSEKGEITLSELETLIKDCHTLVLSKGVRLTFYEFLFFVFCTWAHKQRPQFLLLEVGMGGRFDAVNVFDAQLVLLPSISRDHQEFLGKRYDLILKEKLGVLRKDALLLSYLDLKYLREKAEQEVHRQGAFMVDLESLGLFPSYDFSARNQLLAYAAYLSLSGVNRSDLTLPKTFLDWLPESGGLEHRGEVVKEKNEWIFFGSHNVDGMRKLIQFLDTGNYTFPRPPYAAVIVAFSNRDITDLQAMLKMLKAAGIGPVKLTVFDHPKAATRATIEGLGIQEGLEFVESIDTFAEGKKMGPVLVAGSYYFLGHIKSFLRGQS